MEIARPGGAEPLATADSRGDEGVVIAPDTPRARRRVLEGIAAAAVLSGAPSTAHALATRGGVAGATAYALQATRAIGTLAPPGRPSLVRGTILHLVISAGCGEAMARTLPRRRSWAWGAAAGLAIGIVNVGVIGRAFPAIRALPLVPQLADNALFGVIFAAVADRGEDRRWGRPVGPVGPGPVGGRGR